MPDRAALVHAQGAPPAERPPVGEHEAAFREADGAGRNGGLPAQFAVFGRDVFKQEGVDAQAREFVLEAPLLVQRPLGVEEGHHAGDDLAAEPRGAVLEREDPLARGAVQPPARPSRQKQEQR